MTRNFFCVICELEFQEESLLEQHAKVVHNIVSENLVNDLDPLQVSDIQSKLDQLASSYYRNATKQYKCELCACTYDSRPKYDEHMKSIHDGHLIFKCDLCEETFRTKVDLKCHKRHSHKLRWKCEYCGEKFKIFQMLKDHLAKNHGIKTVRVI